MSDKMKAKAQQGVINLGLVILIFFAVYPLFFTLNTSFRDNEQFLKAFWGLPNPIIWTNYTDAFRILLPYIGNSFFVAFTSIAIIMVVSALASYAFSKLKFPGKDFFYVLIVALLMIPGLLQLIPRFELLNRFGLLNTFSGIMLGYIAGGIPMAIMILRASMEGIPDELFESVRIDGGSELRLFSSIALPLIKPTLGTVAIINLLGIWNDYLWPLIVTSDPKLFTMAVGLINFRSSLGTVTLYGPLFAGFVVGSLPLVIIFLVFMDYFMEGLTAGAVKM